MTRRSCASSTKRSSTPVFGTEDPIGRRIQCGLDTLDFMTIGPACVADVPTTGPATAPEPEIVMPYEQHPGSATALQPDRPAPIPCRRSRSRTRSAARLPGRNADVPARE
jgi:hypothetical protein